MLRYETVGLVAVLTLSRPEVRNAIDGELATEIEARLDEVEASDDLRVAVLTGDGALFCAGVDLRLVAEGRAHEAETERGGFAGLVRRRRVKPLIAACQGPAVAGGAEIALACDLVIAAEDSWFSFPEAQLSLIAGSGGAFRLPHAVPRHVATALLLTGDRLTAKRAHAFGFVNQLSPAADCRATAVGFAESIARAAPAAIRETLRLISETEHLADGPAFAASDRARARLEATSDYLEGTRAFLEKRPPQWTSR